MSDKKRSMARFLRFNFRLITAASIFFWERSWDALAYQTLSLLSDFRLTARSHDRSSFCLGGTNTSAPEFVGSFDVEIVDGSLTRKEVCELRGENRIKLLIFESSCVSASACINVDVNSYTKHGRFCA